MKYYLLVSVDEMWLKGNNRPFYYRLIHNHINDILRLYHRADYEFNNLNNRIFLSSEKKFTEDFIQAMLRVPGIYSVSPAEYSLKTIEDMSKVAAESIGTLTKQTTFKVEATRNDKSFPLNRMEASKEIGAILLKTFPFLKVDVRKPELVVDVRIMPDGCYVSTQTRYGVGGLPVGSSGHAVTMLSGGFDSPVASFLMSHRGLSQTLVFFHAHPFVGDEVKEKILNIAKHLALYNKRIELITVPFGAVQQAIAEKAKNDYRTLFFRRAMVVMSNMIAERNGADAIITGDSLSQVSSQTIQNLAVIDKASDRPVLRPLIGMNKREIIELAEKIGTHDISIIPHDDACALFAPKNPVIRGDSHYTREFFSENNFDQIYHDALAQSELLAFNAKAEQIYPKIKKSTHSL